MQQFIETELRDVKYAKAFVINYLFYRYKILEYELLRSSILIDILEGMIAGEGNSRVAKTGPMLTASSARQAAGEDAARPERRWRTQTG